MTFSDDGLLEGGAVRALVGMLATAVLLAVPGGVFAQQGDGGERPEPAGSESESDQAEEAKSARQRAKKAREAHDEGAALYASGDYARAIVQFQRGHRLYPAAVFLYNIAMSYMQLGKPAEAREYARRAAEAEERKLDDRSLVKSGALRVGSDVALRARRLTSEASELRAGSAAEEPRLRWPGWVGLASAGGGLGGIVTSAVLAADIDRSWSRLESLRRTSDRGAFENEQAEIARKQRLGRAFGIAGLSLTTLGFGLFAVDYFGLVERDQAARVGVEPNGRRGFSLSIRW